MAKDNTLTHPNPTASRKEKATEKYGLAYANFIYNQFYKVSPILSERTSRFKSNLKYAEGLQSIQDVRELQPNNKGTSPILLDIRPINRIAKNISIMLSVLMEQPFSIECNAIDPQSKLIEEGIRNEMRALMHLQQVDRQHNISGRTGIPLVPNGAQIPQTPEELDLYEQMNAKVGISLAMEEAIQFVLDNNDWDYEVKRKVLRNLLACKGAAIYRDYDENYNIVVKAPEFYDVIYPYSKYDTFKNITYVALVEQMTIEQIAMQAKNPDGSPKYSDAELAEIAKQFEGQNYNNPAWNSSWGMSYEGFYQNATLVKPFYNFNIPVMRFWFLSVSKENLVKTTKIDKTTGKTKIFYDWKAREADTENLDNKQNIGVKEKQWRYEGCWIMGSEKYLFNYKESDDIPREKIQGGYNPKTTLPIDIIMPDIYDMENKSKVEAAIPSEEQLNLIEQKIQQCVIDFRPVGYAINQAILEEMKAGTGNDQNKSPVQMHDNFTQTNKLIYYAVDQQGNPLNIQPIQEVPSGFPESFNQLMELRNMYLQTIDDVMGVSPAMNTSAQSPEMPVGTQQFGKQATINSLMDTYKSALNLMERSVIGMSLMIQDCIAKNRKGFIEAIGQGAESTLEMFKNLPLATIGVKVKIGSTEEERMELRQWIALDIKNGALTSDDGMEIDDAMRQNIKLAKALARKLKKQNAKAAQDAEIQKIQANSQQQQDSSKVAGEVEKERIGLQLNADLTVLRETNKLKIEEDDNMAGNNYELQKLKNTGSATDAEIAAGGKVDVQNAADKAKIVTKQIEGNFGIAKEHIKHHSAISALHKKHISEMQQLMEQHDHELELQENEPTPVTAKK